MVFENFEHVGDIADTYNLFKWQDRDCRLKFAGEHLIALLECSRRALGEQFKEFTIEHRVRVC